MKVFTCFSYKGGAGRTVAAANIAAAFASSGKTGAIEEPLNFKTAIVDLDVFSAGTHRVFGISNEVVQEQEYCVQDYLMNQIAPSEHVEAGGIRFDHEAMGRFAARGAKEHCRPDFTLFPAKPDPDRRFVVAKYHENLLLELILELERRGFDYVVLDGEAGTRAMADIAIRLSDVVLMFFRLTWQHVEGTLNVARFYQGLENAPHVYLIPTCVPLVGLEDKIYLEDAPGLKLLRRQTETIPDLSTLNQFAEDARYKKAGRGKNVEGMGYFWASRICIHDSLVLKGGENILVFDMEIAGDRAASDYYRIAAEIARIHPPTEKT